MDLEEDLPEDVLSRVVLHCRAPDALAFAGGSRAMLAAATTTARRLFAQTFGRSELPNSLQAAGARAKLFTRLDRARTEDLACLQETFAWAAGHGYCSYLTRTASHKAPEMLEELLTGPKGREGPPLWRAAKRHQPGAVALLLEMQAEVEKGKAGTTPLFWSARHGDVASVGRLLERGASPLIATGLKDEKGQGLRGGDCPLSAVLWPPLAEPSEGRVEALRLMASSLTSAQRSEVTACRAMSAAAGSGALPYVSVLLEAGCSSQVNEPDVETPLLVALNRGCSEVAELLLAKDKSVTPTTINATLPSGKSALHLAAERGDARLLGLLLRARANADATTSSGRSALHLAVEHGHELAVHALCKHDGTQLRHLVQQTPNGASPICLAERRGKPSLILPMLRCYHRQLRQRYLAGKLGDAGDKVSHTTLTALCLQYRDHLFISSEPDPNAKIFSQAAKVASQILLPDTEEDVNASRYKRVLDQTRWTGVDAALEGRGRLRNQLDLALGARARTTSADRKFPQRRPWGSALVKPRGPKAPPAGALQAPQAPQASQASQARSQAASGTSCPSSQSLAAFSRPSRPSSQGQSQSQSGLRTSTGLRPCEAMAAEDAMQDLLQDFLAGDTEEPGPRNASPSVCGDGGMYSSDEAE
mmetsp:Transcript_66184/g.147085  ORF Transcript_66184/g.147085 Transcript_66184/m.147085 type:complete len:648 (+) Transcript_66184:31-1974(+)